MAITGIDTIEGKQIIAAGAVSAKSAEMAYNDENGNPITGYQVAGDYYSASNPSGFVTSGELPDPVTIGVQDGETLDTDYDGLKIVKSTANGNEHINLHKKSTDQWLIHGNLVPTSPGSNKYLVTDDSGAMHWDNKSALAYDSAFEQSGGYITAYNGSAFKAGDELPSGVMVESGLEYNAVNEISGYNGSAIAQYGAEKQWLVHDDTLVHAANSAQYALGCNISALQRLMGIDETVLFFAGDESSGVQSGNLTESIKNFKRIRVAGMDNDGHTDVKYIYPAWTKNADGFSTSGYEVMLYGANPYASQSTVWEKWTRYSFSALTSFNVVLSYEGSYTANSVNNVTNNHKNSIREVVGIGRISG